MTVSHSCLPGGQNLTTGSESELTLAQRGSGRPQLCNVVMPALAQHGAIVASSPWPRNTRKMAEYSPVLGPAGHMVGSEVLDTRVCIVLLTFLPTHYSSRITSKEEGFEAQKQKQSHTSLKFCVYSVNHIWHKVWKCFLHPPLSRNESQGWQWAEHNLSHPPSQPLTRTADPRDERPDPANQRPVWGPDGQSEGPTSISPIQA